MARARELSGFNCDETFAMSAARVIDVRADEVFEHAEGVLDVRNTERVHDMRVATRRLRAAMEVFEPCFPRRRYRKALRDVKALAEGLGGRRDRDVEIEFLLGFAAEAPEADRKALTRILSRARREQSEANRRLAAFVEAERLNELRRRLRNLVALVPR